VSWQELSFTSQAEPVDRDLREKGSEEPETGHYWSPSSRKVVNETLAAEDILSPDKLSRQPNYKSAILHYAELKEELGLRCE